MFVDIADYESSDESWNRGYQLHSPSTRTALSVYRTWPRDPAGAILHRTQGKTIDDGETNWGASLDDFFLTQPNPREPEVVTVSTSSKLLEFCEKSKEWRYAAPLLSEARSEPMPKEILPYSMTKSIRTFQIGDIPQPKLHHRIPLHLLPQTLLVHDPDDSLHARPRNSVCSSSHNVFKPREYKLCLSRRSEQLATEQRLTLDNQPRRKHGLMLISSTSAFFAEYPPPPSPLSRTESACLTLSAHKRLGVGNHSYVYDASWDIPTAWFIEPTVCRDCGLESLLKKLTNDIPNVSLDDSLSTQQQIAALLHVEALVVIDINDTDAEFDARFSGSVTTIPIAISWSSPGYFYACAHSPPLTCTPLATINVSVAAKLSIQYDSHLITEADNYQEFPQCFFQHWDGYCLPSPMQNPTPCGALVPQFYGYYTPVRAKGDPHPGYQSCILLVEHCGKSIDSITMNEDDKFQCAALLRRMALQGWEHNSVYSRNIVVDYGDIAENPAAHQQSTKKRFRIIDFGRSGTYGRSTDIETNDKHTWRECGISSRYAEKIKRPKRCKNTPTAPVINVHLPMVYPHEPYRPVYPFFDIYPSKISSVDRSEKDVYLPKAYPVIELYHPVYPFFDIYSIDALQASIEEPLDFSTLSPVSKLSPSSSGNFEFSMTVSHSKGLVDNCMFSVSVILPVQA